MTPKKILDTIREALKENGIELFDERFVETDDLPTDMITVAFDDGDSVEQVKVSFGDYEQFYVQLGYDHVLLLTEDTDLDKIEEDYEQQLIQQELIQQEW
jgi:hypothetical protein